MASVPVTDLITRARLESGLRTNAYYDDTSITRYLDAGGAELADIFTQANQHYVISEFDFTTTGQASAIVSLPDDFQQGHSLEIFPQVYNGVATPNSQTRTIKYLPNWLNRNAWSFGAAPFALGMMDPAYTFLDSKLRFYPPQATPSAPFKLYYTPKWATLQPPRSIAIDPGDIVLNSGGFIQYTLTNGAFSSADVGNLLTVTWNAPNAAYNAVLATITAKAPGNSTTVTTNVVWPGGSFTGPAAGTALVQGSLPSIYAPWAEYLVVYAAIAINTDRQRGTGEAERKLNALKARIISTISRRQEEPQQPPLTGGFGDTWGGGFGGGW